MENSANDPDFADFVANLPEHWFTLPDIEVALSGGADSVCLLHLLYRLRQTRAFTLKALHVHHGLQKCADDWVVFCQTLCQNWQIPLRIRYVHVDCQSKLGPEGAAREARQKALAQSDCRVIALAHHQDDQLETFFLALFRGGGLRGMSAMPTLRRWHGHTLWRPLLTWSRTRIEAYLAQHHLDFVTDPTNTDPAFLRNKLRHQILPLLRHEIPHMDRHILHNVTRFQAALNLLDDYQAEDWQQIIEADRMNCRLWAKFSEPRRQELLHRFATNYQLGNPRAASIIDFDQQLKQNPQTNLEWSLPHGKAYAAYGFLWPQSPQAGWWHALQSTITSTDIQWHHQTYGLPQAARTWHIKRATKTDTLPIKQGHKNVFQLLQEARIPPFLRPLWPVLIDDNQVCQAVIGLRLGAERLEKSGLWPQLEVLNPLVMEPKKR